MKKTIIALIVVALMMTSAWAEGFDLTSMNLDDLFALHQAIHEEIDSRLGCNIIEANPGTYVGGVSIDPGSYVFTCTEAEYDDEGAYVRVYKNEEDIGSTSYMLKVNVPVGASCQITILDGWLLMIEDGMGRMEFSD